MKKRDDRALSSRERLNRELENNPESINLENAGFDAFPKALLVSRHEIKEICLMSNKLINLLIYASDSYNSR